MGKEKKISREDIAKMSREERMKYEIAQELGLLDQVLEEGWKTLSAKETGRIGGLITKRKRQLNRIDAFTAGCLPEYRVRRDKMSRIRECQIVDDLAFFFDIRMPGGVFCRFIKKKRFQ